MSLKHAAIAGAILALCTAVDPAPASAQSPNCGDIYNHLMQLSQAAPQSPEYAQTFAAYNAICVAGPSAGPAYSPYDAPDYQPYYGNAAPDYPYARYGYAVPVGAALGLGFGRGFHRDRDFRDHGNFHGDGFQHAGGFQGGGHNDGAHGGGDRGSGRHGGEGHGGGHSGDHGERH